MSPNDKEDVFFYLLAAALLAPVAIWLKSVLIG